MNPPSPSSAPRVAALTLSVSRRAAGMLDCVRRPVQEMRARHGWDIEVLSLRDDRTDDDLPDWRPVPVRIFVPRGPAKLAFAPALAAHLRRGEFGLAHTFGLWTDLSRVASAWHRRTRRPYLVTPQGMLDPWALAHSRWRKRLAGALYEYAHLRRAGCLHATCQAELAAFRAFGLRGPVCVVPNGVDVPGDAATAPRLPDPDGRSVLLFLGRIHPKKGLPNLLRGWARAAARHPAGADGWRLKVAGWDQGGHAHELGALVRELGLQASVDFVGPLYGAAKAGALRAADAFVLPSFSEGLPLSVLEAWSYRLPVLMTPACNLPEGFAAGAAWRAEPEAESLAGALDELFRATPSERRDRGQRGRSLVEQKFSWGAAARAMSEVYGWLAGGGPAPACVVR